ncbi:MAG: isoprenylcysteine carboxylmethyltransferase family protein [Oscillospiraceae bacterium]|nr:isoprenylcysteine carboxylmethyltransferase family protein [Oscillospiraceae bacterium]
MNRKQLAVNALIKYIAGLIIIALLLFVPAGTLHYPNGWLFISLLFIPMLMLGLVLLVKSPSLLEKRLKSKEERTAQTLVVKISALAFILSFITAGIDFRLDITCVPRGMVAVAAVILLVSYALYAEVMRENAYLSRTIEVQQEQKVVDKGLYSIVRHPMYAATVLLFLSIPLVLGSWISFAIMLVYPFAIVLRIRDEEKLLLKELDGYAEYTEKVKYRLIPFIW